MSFILDLPGLELVFVTGVFALFSPCGFPMLPGYVSYYIGTKASAKKALVLGLACVMGLLSVFVMIGVGVSLVGGFVSPYIPFLGVVAGILMIGMGVSTLLALRFPTLLTISWAPSQKGLMGGFLYGIAYGLTTLGCSAPVFFSILFYSFAAGGIFNGLLTFVVYALGMGFPLILVAVLVAKSNEIVVNRLVKFTPLFQKISGIVLIVIGVYLILYHFVLSG